MNTSRPARLSLALLGLTLSLAACEGTAGTGVIDVGAGLGPGGDGSGGTTDCTALSGDPKVVCLANAFKATLTPTQQSLLQLQFTAANAINWSYFPCGNSCRNGIQLGALTQPQLSAALALSREALQPFGYATFDAVRTADYILSQQRAGYGGGLYNVAFVGAPSNTTPWLMQVSGNNFAINLAYSGDSLVGTTPFAVGSEPQSFSANGSSYMPMQWRKSAMYALVNSLDATQRAQAQLVGVAFDDLLLGPGQDANFPAPQGVLVSSLTAGQQSLVKSAIEAWVDDAPILISAEMLGDYESDSAMAATRVAWATSTDSTVSGSYVRIDGPRVWIELLGHTGDVFTSEIRFRSIWRDKEKDYGGLLF